MPSLEGGKNRIYLVSYPFPCGVAAAVGEAMPPCHLGSGPVVQGS
jgi:hypothetical protein